MGYWLSGRFEGVEIASNGERKETFSGQIGATVEGPYHRYRIDVDDRIPRYAGLDLGVSNTSPVEAQCADSTYDA